MYLSKDFVEFIESLNRNGVEFLVIGAFAVGFHARPRETSDLDVWINSSTVNLERVWQALSEFGFTIDRSGDGEPFLKHGETLQLGYPPNRIDLLTSVSGIDFEPAWNHRVEGELFGRKVCFIGINELLENKRASGRDKDLHDVNTITRIREAAESAARDEKT